MPAVALLKLQTGPVQDFISEAGKTRDLWAGAWLLSHLTRTGALAIQNQPGVELICPLLDAPGDPLEASTPDFILARVPASNSREIARIAEDAIRTEWKRIADAVHGAVSSQAAPDWDTGWKEQTERFPQVDWIVHPCPSATEALKQLDRGEPPLPANAPDFRKPGASLEALEVAMAEWKLAAKKNSRAFGACPAEAFRRPVLPGKERLSALALVHRLFPEAYLWNVQGWNPFAPDFDFVEHLATAIDAEEDDLPPGSPVSYAVLTLDGDDLGRWLCGCMGTQGDLDPLQPGYPAKLSQRLSTFAERASGIVDQYVGQTIRCAGDEVLALLPTASALPCAEELARAFAQALPGGSASAGIAVGHVRAPLPDTVRAAFAAKAAAKSLPGKDAFCLRVLKRSGEHADLTVRWKIGVGKVWRDLEERKRVLSHRFAQFLAGRLMRLVDHPAQGRENGSVPEEWTGSAKEAALLELIHGIQDEAGLPRNEAEALAQAWHPVLTRLAPQETLQFWLVWAFLRRVDDSLDSLNADDA